MGTINLLNYTYGYQLSGNSISEVKGFENLRSLTQLSLLDTKNFKLF